MVTVLAFSLQDQVEKYGAYVGLAAFLGLAVLSLLYFAQARELKRLRDWAGRAPERAQEIEARVVAQAEEARRAEAAPAVTPAPASGNGRPEAAPVPVPMGPRPAVAAAALAAAGGQVATVPAVAWPGGEEAAPAEAEPAEAAGDGRPPAETAGDGGAPAETAGDGGVPAEAAGDEGAPAEDGPPAEATDQPPVAEDEPSGDEAAAPEAGAGPAAPAEEESPAADEAPPARTGNGVPSEPPHTAGITPAPVPRATPRPAPAPRRAPAAPLRASGQRSATLPPRRPAAPPARRQAAGDGSSAGRIALIAVMGAIVLGAGAFTLMQVLDDGDEPAPPPNRATEAGGAATAGSGSGAGERAVAARPETVVVVLNGTLIDGLASDKRDALVEEGYSDEEGMIRTGDNTDQQRQDSVVFFPRGQRRQARDVASILGIDTIEAIDPDTQAFADLSDTSGSGLSAEVVVVLGADQAP